MEEQKTDTTESKLKAKPTSLIGQIVAAVWIAGWCVYKFTKAADITVTDIIMSGLAIAACFTPVYFSILMDKIKAIKYGDAE